MKDRTERRRRHPLASTEDWNTEKNGLKDVAHTRRSTITTHLGMVTVRSRTFFNHRPRPPAHVSAKVRPRPVNQMIWIPDGLKGTPRMARPTVTLVLVALMLLGALIKPAEEDNLSQLRGWTEFVSYMASHPALKTPLACAELVAGDRAMVDDAVPGDPREAQRRCDRVVEQLNLTGWRRVAFVPRRGLFQLGALGHLFVHKSGLVALLNGLFFLLLIGSILENVWGPKPLVGLYLLGAMAGTTTLSLTYGASEIPFAGSSLALAACSGAFAWYFAPREARFVVWSLGGKREEFAPAAWLVSPWFVVIGISLFRNDFGASALVGQVAAAACGVGLAALFDRAGWIPSRTEATNKETSGPVIPPPRMPTYDAPDGEQTAAPSEVPGPGATESSFGDVDAPRRDGESGMPNRHAPDDTTWAKSSGEASSDGPAWTVVQPASAEEPAPRHENDDESSNGDVSEGGEASPTAAIDVIEASASSRTAPPKDMAALMMSEVAAAAHSTAKHDLSVERLEEEEEEEAARSDRSRTEPASQTTAHHLIDERTVAHQPGQTLPADVMVYHRDDVDSSQRVAARGADEAFDPTADLDFAPASRPGLFADSKETDARTGEIDEAPLESEIASMLDSSLGLDPNTTKLGEVVSASRPETSPQPQSGSDSTLDITPEHNAPASIQVTPPRTQLPISARRASADTESAISALLDTFGEAERAATAMDAPPMRPAAAAAAERPTEGSLSARPAVTAPPASHGDAPEDVDPFSFEPQPSTPPTGLPDRAAAILAPKTTLSAPPEDSAPVERTRAYSPAEVAESRRVIEARRDKSRRDEGNDGGMNLSQATREGGIARAVPGGYRVQFASGGEGVLLRTSVRAVAVGLVPADAGKRSLVTAVLLEKSGGLEIWLLPLTRINLDALAQGDERPAATWRRVVDDIARAPAVKQAPRRTDWPGPPYSAFDDLSALKRLLLTATTVEAG